MAVAAGSETEFRFGGNATQNAGCANAAGAGRAWFLLVEYPVEALRLVFSVVRDILRCSDSMEVAVKTQGELEAAICEAVRSFEQEYMGRGPKSIHTHLIDDILVIRLKGVLTAAEQQLVKTLPVEKGRGLLKEVRCQLIETARPILEKLVQDVTGVAVISLHHDISTATGEEIVLFTLNESPICRETKPR